MTKPTNAQTAQRVPQWRQVLWEAMSWPQRTEGQKGTMVKMRTATYLPRLRVGASSEVTARAVSSLIPAPAPAMDMPAVGQTSSAGVSCGREAEGERRAVAYQ